MGLVPLPLPATRERRSYACSTAKRAGGYAEVSRRERRRAGTPMGGPPLRTVAGRSRRWSLQGDRGSGALEGLLGLLGGLLGDVLENRLRRGLDQVLGLLQAEGGQGAHLLDDVDLLVAGRLQDDVELVLVGGLVGTAGSGAARGGRRGDGDRGGRGHAEGVLELLDELAQLDQRHLLERVEQLVGAELRHGGITFRSRPGPGLGFRWVRRPVRPPWCRSRQRRRWPPRRKPRRSRRLPSPRWSRRRWPRSPLQRGLRRLPEP